MNGSLSPPRVRTYHVTLVEWPLQLKVKRSWPENWGYIVLMPRSSTWAQWSWGFTLWILLVYNYFCVFILAKTFPTGKTGKLTLEIRVKVPRLTARRIHRFLLSWIDAFVIKLRIMRISDIDFMTNIDFITNIWYPDLLNSSFLIPISTDTNICSHIAAKLYCNDLMNALIMIHI